MKLPAAQRMAKLQELRDKERLNLIHYDETVAKVENQNLKYELKNLQAIRRHEQMSKQLAKSKSMRHMAISQSMIQQKNQAGAAVDLQRSHSPQNMPLMYESNVGHLDSLPAIKRKGTGYHKRFVKEVRPRDYGLYLNSLNAVKEYRQIENQNKNIKDQLFRERYRQSMNQFKQDSKYTWDRLNKLDYVSQAKCIDPGHEKLEKSKKVSTVPVQVKKPEPEKKPESEKKVEPEKKPEPEKKVEPVKAPEKKPDPVKKPEPAPIKANNDDF